MKCSITDEDPFGSAPFPYKSLSNFNDFFLNIKIY